MWKNRSQHVLLVAILSSTSDLAAEDGRGEPEFERAFLGSLQSVTRTAKGRQFGFRYRKVESRCSRGESAPEKTRDGLVRVAFKEDAILVEEIYVAQEPGELPIPTRVVTHYSILAGEYARSTRIAGGISDMVILDHWAKAPETVYIALGLVQFGNALDGVEPIRMDLEDGTRRSVFYLDQGTTVTMDYDYLNGPQLQRAEVKPPDSGQRKLLYFYDCVSLIPDRPLSPTLACAAHIDEDGCVRRAETWRSIMGNWAEAAWDYTVAPGAEIIDFRARSATATSASLDRPVMLGALLVYPLDQVADTAHGRTDYEYDRPVKDEALRSGDGRAWWVSGTVIVVLLVGGAARRIGK